MTKKRLIKLAIGIPLMAVVWYFVVKHLGRGFKELQERGWANVHVQWGWLALSVASLLCARFTNAINCKQVLGAMGERVTARQVVPIIWLASLGRYVPGKVSVVAGAVAMLMRLGVRLPVAVASLFLSTALMILVGLVACAPLMFTAAVREKFPYGWLVSAVMLVGGVVGLHPAVFTRLCNVALKRMKKPPLPDRLRAGPYLRAIGNTVLRTLFLGLALFFACKGLDPISWKHYPLAVASAGFASVAGFLAVFSPAGLGVHEAIYLLTLRPLLGAEAALMVVLFRFFNLLADAITGATGMFLLKGQGVSPAPPEVQQQVAQMLPAK